MLHFMVHLSTIRKKTLAVQNWYFVSCLSLVSERSWGLSYRHSEAPLDVRSSSWLWWKWRGSTPTKIQDMGRATKHITLPLDGFHFSIGLFHWRVFVSVKQAIPIFLLTVFLSWSSCTEIGLKLNRTRSLREKSCFVALCLGLYQTPCGANCRPVPLTTTPECSIQELWNHRSSTSKTLQNLVI